MRVRGPVLHVAGSKKKKAYKSIRFSVHHVLQECKISRGHEANVQQVRELVLLKPSSLDRVTEIQGIPRAPNMSP